MIFETLGTSAVHEFAQHLFSIMDSLRIMNELDSLCARRLLKANSLIQCCVHAASLPCCAVALRSRFQNGVVGARQGRGMVCVNETRPHCVNQMGKTQSKPLAKRHGRGTA